MLNTLFRLTAPRMIEPVVMDMPVDAKSVIVRPTYLSICNADMRYFLGKRPAEILARKLPMALIHEGMGRVLFDASGAMSRGARVVMLPNQPYETDEIIGENYLRSSQFCGSGFDGFMQENVVLPPERVMVLPDNVPNEVGAFTELVSVAMHALRRFERVAHERRERIGVWGDGNLGYIVCLLLHALIPDVHITIIGRNASKMADFTFVDEACSTYEVGSAERFDHAFECAGGDGSASAIEQIIDVIRPEGTIALLGVSENPVPITTRMVLEKGLRLFGSSRSAREDFAAVLALYEENPAVPEYLRSLIGGVYTLRNVADITRAFDADLQKRSGKTIMKWDM